MKKIFLTSILTVLFVIPIKTYGQAALLVLLLGDKVASENFYFSIKVGGNFSNLMNTEKSKFSSGLNFGLLANIKLSNKFYLVPEFAPLSRKGAQNILVHPTGNEDFDNLLTNASNSEIQLNYIDIPVILKYYPFQKFNVGLGPYFSILTSGENYYETNASTAGDLRIYQDVKTTFNPVDYGMMVEAAYAPWRNTPHDDLNFHVRFSYGLSDIIKEGNWNSVNNYAFQLYVSIPFIKTEEE